MERQKVWVLIVDCFNLVNPVSRVTGYACVINLCVTVVLGLGKSGCDVSVCCGKVRMCLLVSGGEVVIIPDSLYYTFDD